MEKRNAQRADPADPGADEQDEVSISRLEEEEKSVNPLVAGEDVEQNFVVLQRLYMDCQGAPAKQPAGVDGIRDYVMAELAEKALLERKQIDLSYVPRGHLRAAAAIRQRAALSDACELLLHACCPEGPRVWLPPGPKTDENLRKELLYLQRWADALHSYDVTPAVHALESPLSLSSSAASAAAASASLHDRGDHAASCLAGSREAGARAAATKRQGEQQGTLLERQASTTDPKALATLLQQQRGRGRRRGRTASAAPLAFPLQPPPPLRPPKFCPPRVGAARLLQSAGWRAVAATYAVEEPRGKEGEITEDEDEELRELLRAPSALPTNSLLPQALGVREVVEMFERGRGKTSEHVKMLELDCRRLLQQVRQREAERDGALERLRQAMQEKARLAKEMRLKQKILKQREEALAVILDEHDCVRRVLERKLQNNEKIKEEQEKEIATSKSSLAILQSRLVQSEVQLSNQGKSMEELRSHLDEVQKQAEVKETELLEERRALYTEDRMKLERIHFQCECLGEDRLRLFEALRRDRATLDLRDAEIVLYRKHMEVLTKERNYYARACEEVELRGREEKAQLQARFEDELSRCKERVNDEKGKHAETAKALAKAQQQHARQQELLGRFKAVAQAQQAHLKTQATAFSSLMERLLGFKDRLGALEKLVESLKTAQAAYEREMAGATFTVSAEAGAREPAPSALHAEGEPGVSAAPAAELTIPKGTLMRSFAQAAEGRTTLSVAKAVEAARKLGLAPSEADVEALTRNSGGEVTAEAFTQFCSTCAHPEDAADNMARFFSLWDSSGSGTLPATRIQQLLQAFGEPLSGEDAQFAVKVFGEGKELIDYRDFCKKLLGTSAEQMQ